jgi:hypothetical protein
LLPALALQEVSVKRSRLSKVFVSFPLCLHVLACGGNATVSGADDQDAGSSEDASPDKPDATPAVDADSAVADDASDAPNPCQHGCWSETSEGMLKHQIPISSPAHAWTGHGILLYGGYHFADSTGLPQNAGQIYDPVLDVWSRTTDGPYGTDAYMSAWTGSLLIDVRGGSWYDPASDAWVTGSDLTTWTDELAQAVWVGDYAIAWGGEDESGQCGKMYAASTGAWSSLSPVDKTLCRRSPLVLAVDDRMLVWGGTSDGEAVLRTGALFDPETGTWEPTATQGSPSPRLHPFGVWTGTEVVVWGGSVAGSFDGLNDGAIYDPETNSWREMASLDGEVFGDGTAVWGDGRMFVWMGDTRQVSGAIYDPDEDEWAVMSTTDAPKTDHKAAVVWTGTDLFVWGGRGGKEHGWLYRPPSK